MTSDRSIPGIPNYLLDGQADFARNRMKEKDVDVIQFSTDLVGLIPRNEKMDILPISEWFSYVTVNPCIQCRIRMNHSIALFMKKSYLFLITSINSNAT